MLVLEGMCGQHHAVVGLLPGRTQNHCTEGWVSIETAVDSHRKSRPLPVFDPWTVQLIASRCTVYAIQPALMHLPEGNFET